MFEAHEHVYGLDRSPSAPVAVLFSGFPEIRHSVASILILSRSSFFLGTLWEGSQEGHDAPTRT